MQELSVAVLVVLAVLMLGSAPCAAQTPVGRFEVFELTFVSDRTFDNPFTEVQVSATFTAPDGRAVKLEGFYFQGNEWKVRFVPDTVGTWKYEATLTGKGEPVKQSGSFQCVKSDRHGFVRISKKNPYRFEYDDGVPFYPIGQQGGWGVSPRMGFDGPQEGQWGTTDLETFMKAFTGATNLMRCQLGTGTTAGVALDMLAPGATDRYNLENCAKFDLSGKTLKQYGWSVDVILFQDMSLWGGKPNGFGPPQDNRGVYKSLTSPMLPNVERYLRYIVARYSCYTDIWELYNEDSYAPNDFLAHLAKVVRDADPYDHPITTNYERPDQPWCEIVCPHEYVTIPAKDVPYFLSKEFARLKSFGKPVQYTEFGNKSSVSNYDPVKWRQAAWTCFMNEGGMLYWNMSGRKTVPNPAATGNSNTYLGPETRQAFRVLADFTKDLPVTMRPVMAGFDGRLPVEVWALGNDQVTVVYVNHADTHEGEVDVADVPVWTGPGRFHLKWIEPATGKVVREQDLGTRQFVLWLDVPPVKEDLAAKLEVIK